MKLTIAGFLLLVMHLKVCNAQAQIKEVLRCDHCNKIEDTSSFFHKLCYFPSNTNIIKRITERKVVKQSILEVYCQGIMINKQKEGWWNVYDTKNRLLVQELYDQGIWRRTIYYSGNRIIAMEIVDYDGTKYEKGGSLSTFQLRERIVYSRSGSVKKHYFYKQDGSIWLKNSNDSILKKLETKETPNVKWRKPARIRD